MSKKKHKFLCICMVFLIFISGMYVNEIKTDVSFTHSLQQTTASYLSEPNAVMTGVQACTAEMLGIRAVIGSGQEAVKSANQRRDMKLSLDFLCQNIFSFHDRNSFFRFNQTLLVSESSYELVINYIHNSDGEK